MDDDKPLLKRLVKLVNQPIKNGGRLDFQGNKCPTGGEISPKSGILDREKILPSQSFEVGRHVLIAWTQVLQKRFSPPKSSNPIGSMQGIFSYRLIIRSCIVHISSMISAELDLIGSHFKSL